MSVVFTSVLDPSHEAELLRLLFFNRNQHKIRNDVLLLIERYGMAHVRTVGDCLRIVFDSSPEPQTLYVLERSDGHDSLVGVMVYLREEDRLSLVIAAVREDYVATGGESEEPLLRKMIKVLSDVARRVKGVTSVVVFPGTSRERTLHVP